MGPLPQTLRVAIYLRVSMDRRKRRSVTQQDKACREELRSLGLDPGAAAVYDDNDKSASGYAKKRREDWARLLADVEADKIDFIIMWESSRGGRDDLPWIQFLRLCQSKGVLIHVVKDKRTYDVRNYQDYDDLAHQGLNNAKYSAEASQRIQRDKEWMREEGLPDGKVPFGWKRDYDPKTGDLIAQRPDPENVPMVRRILESIVKGFALSTIAKDTELSRNQVRRIALNPAHVGRRYIPGTQEIDERPGNWGVLYEGVEKVWWQARRILLAPERKTTTKPGRAKYLVSYIALAECGGVVQIMTRHKYLHYVCSVDQCVGVKREWLDAHVFELLVERFSDPEVFDEVLKSDDADVVSAHAEADRLQSSLDDMWASVKADRLPLSRYLDAEAEYTPQIKAARERARNAGIPPQLRHLASLSRNGDPETVKKLVRVALKEIPIAGLRDIVRLVFDYIRLNRISEDVRGRGKFDPSRVEHEWRTSWT